MTITDFEDIFEYIGGFGKFQYSLFAANCLINIFLATVYYGQMFMTLTPPHWCRPPPEVSSLNLTEEEVKLLTLPWSDHSSDYESCVIYNVDFVEIVTSNESWPDPTWPSTSCTHGWSYNYSLYYPTITSELNWVCDEDWRPVMAQSLFFVGSMIGCSTFGWAADRWGRLPMVVVANVLSAVAGMASAFSNTFVIFVILRFIVGLTYEQHYCIAYVLLLEYVGKKYRTFMANVPILLFLTLSTCSLPWIACGIGDWFFFTFVINAPLLLSVLFIWMVPESARWLISRGRVDDTIKIIEKAAACNGKTLSQNVIQDFRAYGEKQAAIAETEGVPSVLDLLKTPVLRKRFLILTLMWIVVTLAYDGHLRNAQNIGSNAFVSFTILSFVEFPADIVVVFLIDWMGRRNTTVLALVFCGIAGLSIMLVHEENTNMILGLAMIGCFMVTMAINVGQQYQVEVLPTVARTQGMGAIQTATFGATLASPYIVYLSKYGYYLPYAILGVLTLVGGTACIFLPETINENIPNTLEEGEAAFSNQGFCYNPCRRRKKEATEAVAEGNEVTRF
ncbi:organic cation transporter protein-like [Macrobrachium rosenbergii]|uniref:organic cation transporter protein-like n=1 Tax=Macrobrachium rosenbergii TaxID=79674 RepID=UPI0034D56C25